MDLAVLQEKMSALTTKVANTTSVEASAVTLLSTLGAFFVAHKDDPAAIEALGVAMTNADGDLDTSAASLAAAITANTPAQEPV